MKSGGFPDYLDDLLSPFPGVRMRRMFGGVGIFGDGLMFALLADEVLYLKSDGVTDPRFEAEGCEPFAYGTRDGRRTIMSYRRAPERLFDDPDAFREWAEGAMSVARRAAATKPPRRSAAIASTTRKAPKTRSSGRTEPE